MSRTYTGPLRADKETFTRHATVGEPLWEKREDGLYYSVETGEQVEVEEVSLAELINRLNDL